MLWLDKVTLIIVAKVERTQEADCQTGDGQEQMNAQYGQASGRAF